MRRRTWIAVSAVGAVVVMALVGAGRFVWRDRAARAFGARYAAMNEHYKQALYLTGQGQREAALAEHAALVAALADLRRQGSVPGDEQAAADLSRAAAIADRTRPLVEGGTLRDAHQQLEELRPILNELLRRNGLSSLKVALVDFHDRMERVIEAGDARDPVAVLGEIPAADARLRAVEQELNDGRVRAIRAALERVQALAQHGDREALPAAAGALKSAFVRVYLVEG